jgi:predicted Zn-dependent protease
MGIVNQLRQNESQTWKDDAVSGFSVQRGELLVSHPGQGQPIRITEREQRTFARATGVTAVGQRDGATFLVLQVSVPAPSQRAASASR